MMKEGEERKKEEEKNKILSHSDLKKLKDV